MWHQLFYRSVVLANVNSNTNNLNFCLYDKLFRPWYNVIIVIVLFIISNNSSFLDLLLQGHLFIGLVYVLPLDTVPFARRLFQIFLTLLFPSVKCHLNVCNISEKYNQSLSTNQKTVCILICMCLKGVSCFLFFKHKCKRKYYFSSS